MMKAFWARQYREQKNHTLAFRYTLVPGEGTVLTLAAASLYRIFVNGKLAAYGPARAAHGWSRIDRYELCRFGTGRQVLTVEVSAPNINSFYTVDELPFFAAEITEGERCIATAEDFEAWLLDDRVTRVQRFSFQRTFVESYVLDGRRAALYAGGPVSYPAVELSEVEGNRQLPRGVSDPKLEHVGCRLLETGTVTEDPDAPVWNDRCLDNIGPMLRGFPREQLEECLSDEISHLRCQRGTCADPDRIRAGEYRLYDFGESCTGFCSFEMDVAEDATLYLTFDELAPSTESCTQVDPFRNGCCNVMKFRLSRGTHQVLTYEANTMHFLNLILTGGSVTLRSLGMITYENPDTRRLPSTGDRQLDAIVEASRRTFAQNAVDVLTDCPSRERAGWLCDSYFSARAERMFTGDNKVERNFLENYVMSPQSPYLPEGMLPMCYPADHNDGGYIPNWPMWLVLELEGYLKRTGDRELVMRAEKRVDGLLNFFRGYENEDGLLENLEGWVFIEWSRCNSPEYTCGVNYPTNMLYAKVLETAGRLYDNPDRIRKAEQIRSVIAAQAFDGTFFGENRVRQDGRLVPTGNLSETCQYYAFYFGLATRESHPALYETLLHQFGPRRDPEKVYPEVAQSNAIVGNYLRLEILLQDGLYDEVLDECRRFFYDMALRTNTLWEHSRASCSLNHGFASIAANYITEAVRRKNEAQA